MSFAMVLPNILRVNNNIIYHGKYELFENSSWGTVFPTRLYVHPSMSHQPADQPAQSVFPVRLESLSITG